MRSGPGGSRLVGSSLYVVGAQLGAAPSLRTHEALSLGVTPGELAGPRWHAPTRGVRRPAGPLDDRPLAAPPMQRLYDVAELLPHGAAIGGWGAAYLLGALDLDGRGDTGLQLEPVPIVLPPPLLVRVRPEIVRWRSALADQDVEVVNGVPCTAAARTGFDLARRLPLRRAVVALDALGRQAGLAPEAVLRYRHQHRRWRGVPRVDTAVSLADPRARSTGETRLRLVWVLDAGLPAPEVNPWVLGADGSLLGMGDLLDPEAGLLGEYDGAGHRDLMAHALDNAREEWLEDSGLVVVRAAAPDLWVANRRRTVLRLQTAHRRGLSRDRHRDRWTWTPQPRPPSRLKPSP